VARYADLRGDRAPEILTQMGGAGTFFAAVPYLHPDRTPKTLELLAAALRLANFTEMRFKHALACRRPNELSPQIQPIILTPSHGSLPSGHGTEAFITATVLGALLRTVGTASAANPQYGEVDWTTLLMRLAARVAINRTVAGVHFPVDSAAGALLGLTLGQYFVTRCTGTTTYLAWGFDGTEFPNPSDGKPPPDDGDFYWTSLYDPAAAKQIETDYAIKRGSQTMRPKQSAILAWLWDAAKGEWS
jgi:hypothetical protein